jgi:hypothetical protein
MYYMTDVNLVNGEDQDGCSPEHNVARRAAATAVTTSAGRAAVTRVGFAGLGEMGEGMAARLVRARLAVNRA